MGPSRPSRRDSNEAGWGHLSEGRWVAARRSFERSLTLTETAEALEGLSWAAWWLDDARTVFDARERAYRIYRRNADPSGAARMATWLAADHFDFYGAAAVANGWLRRARRLLDPLEPCPEEGWLAFHEGFLANAVGDHATAREQGRVAADVGRRDGVADLEMLGLGLEGAALVASAQVREGMRCLDEATATALEGEAQVPISIAWACCFLVGACTAVMDLERAFEWCDRIAAFAERYGSRYMLAFCRAEYGSVHLWRGRWAEAEAVLEASLEDFAASRPAWAEAPLVELAELRRRQGRPDDAALLLERAGVSHAARLCKARLWIDAGETLRAADSLERLLRSMQDERGLDAVPAYELLIRARVDRGELDEAAAALEVLREVDGRVGTPPLHAIVQVSDGLIAAAAGDHERARRSFEDALDGFERAQAPFDAARVRIELVTTLVALGRTDAAEQEASSALATMLELGAHGEAERARRVREHAAVPDMRGSSTLTSREREVLSLIAEGLTNRQIASRLVVSEHTVHRHVTNILRKLDLPSRTAAAALAVRLELVAGTGHPQA